MKAMIGKLKNGNCVIQDVALNKSVGPVSIRANPVHFLITGCFSFLSNTVASTTTMIRVIQGEYSVTVLSSLELSDHG